MHNPAGRDPLMVLLDVKDGFVWPGSAPGTATACLLTPETWKIDWRETGEGRGRPRPLQGEAAGSADVVR